LDKINILKNKKSFIVLAPDQNAPGGVSLFCKTLKKNMAQDFLFFHRKSNSYPKQKSYLKKVTDQTSNIIYFFRIMLSKKHINGVMINVSFSKTSILREVIYVLICKIFLKSTVIFFHGWQKTDVKFFQSKGKFLLKFVLADCKHIFVLSDEFKNDLIELGVTVPISVTTTMFDDSDLIKPNEIDISNKYNKPKKNYTAIFLSRIEKEKGIYEAIEIIKWLNISQKDYIFNLSVIGDGTEYNNVIKLINSNIIFHGFLGGPSKYKLLTDGDFFLFPTYYGEGFPITITEAMACGLPIFTRPVGGIKDFFKSEMGFCSESLHSEVIGHAILEKINNNELRKIALFNYNYAWENFAASRYVINFQNKLNEIFF
jgi:glycosyltransferase involved in cell wall biosynthesis